MNAVRIAALASALALVGLAVFAVSHVHGVSDPATVHTFGDHFLLAQAGAGFVFLGRTVMVFALIALGVTAPHHCRSVAQHSPWSYASRAPPHHAS